MARRDLPPDEITPTTPLRLDVAAKVAFPGGGITAASLRRESEKGRLEIERIANKDFVTLKAIEVMRERCRVPPKADAVRWQASRAPRRSDESDDALAHAALQRRADQIKAEHAARRAAEKAARLEPRP